MSTSRKIKPRRRAQRRYSDLKSAAIHQVELMIAAQRRLNKKPPLSKAVLRRRATGLYLKLGDL